MRSARVSLGAMMAALDPVALAAQLSRIEQRQTAYEVVAHKLIGMLEVHNEKLDAILAACTDEPPPSPVVDLLRRLVDAASEQTALLRALPETIAHTVRDEVDRELNGGDPEPEWTP
jgi:hypothetical protein